MVVHADVVYVVVRTNDEENVHTFDVVVHTVD